MKKRNSRLISIVRQLRAKPALSGPIVRAILLGALSLASGLVIVLSQGTPQIAVSQGLQQQEDQVIRKFDLPPAAAPEPPQERAPESVAPEPVAPEPVAPEPVAPEPVAPSNSQGSGSQSNPTPQPTPTPTPNSKTPESKSQTQPSKDPLKQDMEVATGPQSQYLLEFNRSPAIGNRFRLEGIKVLLEI